MSIKYCPSPLCHYPNSPEAATCKSCGTDLTARRRAPRGASASPSGLVQRVREGAREVDFGKVAPFLVAVLAFFVLRGVVSGGGWKEREVAGLSMESPARFRQESLDTIPGMALLKVMGLEVEIHKSNRGGMEVAVARMQYPTGFPVNLDGAAQGGVAELEKMPEVSGLEPSVTTVDFKGMPARKISLRYSGEGKPRQAEGYVFSRGQTLWMVQTDFSAGQENSARAARVLDSVRIR